MSAIHQLISHYQYEVQYPLTPAGGRRRGDVIPLVVNTQGWVKGLGEDLMRAIEVAAEPTHVFAFEAQDEFLPTAGGGWTNSPVHQTTDLPFAAPWEMGASGSGASPPIVCSLQPAPSSPLQARYTAADMRSLSTISYMYARLGAAVHWDFSVPLFAIPPWTVNLGPGGTLSRAYLIGESADAVLPADLPIALNGSLVALLEAPASDEDVYTPATMPPVDHSSFLGLALVRAVRSDPASDANLQLQIITPLPATVLSRATAVVRNGALELPTPAMLDFRDRPPGGGVAEDGLAGTRWDDVPFFDAADSRAVGGDRRRFRRNLQRKGN
jgi:polynucleotide 5'-hydroxyl-kinase GRC3/NOL9